MLLKVPSGSPGFPRVYLKHGRRYATLHKSFRIPRGGFDNVGGSCLLQILALSKPLTTRWVMGTNYPPDYKPLFGVMVAVVARAAKSFPDNQPEPLGVSGMEQVNDEQSKTAPLPELHRGELGGGP